MNYLNMSDTEKEIFKKDIEKALLKKYWPVVTFMFLFGLFLIKGTYWFDNNIATKADVQRLEVKVGDLNTTMQSYIQSNEDVHIKLRGGIAVNRNSIDSLGKIVAIKYRFVTEYRDKNGKTHVND